MLTIYRRHRKSCKQHARGRKYRHCQCPIWVDGAIGGNEIRESLKLRDWQRARAASSMLGAESTATASALFGLMGQSAARKSESL